PRRVRRRRLRAPAWGSAETPRILLEGGVDAQGGGDHQAAEGILERTMDLHHVVVGRREQRLGEALPRFGDAGDLDAGVIPDVEVPRPQVLGVDRPPGVAARLEREADLADGVLLDDLPPPRW